MQKGIYSEALNVCIANPTGWHGREVLPHVCFHLGGHPERKPQTQEQQDWEPCVGARGVFVSRSVRGAGLRARGSAAGFGQGWGQGETPGLGSWAGTGSVPPKHQGEHSHSQGCRTGGAWGWFHFGGQLFEGLFWASLLVAAGLLWLCGFPPSQEENKRFSEYFQQGCWSPGLGGSPGAGAQGCVPTRAVTLLSHAGALELTLS